MAHGKAILDYADEEGQQPLLAQYHTLALRTITVEQERKLVGQNTKLLEMQRKLDILRVNYHALTDRLENWGEEWRLSCGVVELLNELIDRAQQSQLRAEENSALREHVDQAIADREAKAEQLTEAQQLIAEVYSKLSGTYGSFAETEVKIRAYCSAHGLLPAEDEIPF